MLHTTMSIAIVSLLVACASGGDPAQPSAARAGGSGTEMSTAPIAPPPYPAALIRAHTKNGRTYVFRMEAAGKPPMLRRMRFTDVDETGAVVTSEQGPELPPPGQGGEGARMTWEELEAHAHYPAAATTITKDETEVPAGKFACRLYHVTSDDGVTRAWFADDLPGAPVRLEIEAGGTVVMRMTLVEYSPGT